MDVQRLVFGPPSSTVALGACRYYAVSSHSFCQAKTFTSPFNANP